MGRLSAVAMTALLVSSSLLSIQLLLLPAPASAVGPVVGLAFRGVQIIATPIMKKLVSDLIAKKEKEAVTDLSKGSKSKDNEQAQLGSSAAQGYGPVVLNLTVGTPATQNISGIIDITFQAIWTQCAPCDTVSCRSTGTFRYADSSSFSSVLCNDEKYCIVRQPVCTASNPGGCFYRNYYGTDAVTGMEYRSSGYLATDSFTFGDGGAPPVRMVFGCSTVNTLDFSPYGATGIIGFSMGYHSIVKQLELTKFSYLLATDDVDGSESIIRLGDAVPKTKVRSTPLVTNRFYPYIYYVRLTGIQVDGELLTGIPARVLDIANDGTGGVFLSTTLQGTYLNVNAYSALRSALVSKIQKKGLSPVKVDDLYHLCYPTLDFDKVPVPKLTLVFDGAEMELTTANYFFNAAGTTCLSILPSSGVSILGSLLQTGTNMIYDIGGQKLTFEPAAENEKKEKAGSSSSVASSQVSFMITAAPLLLSWVLLF